MSRFKEVALDAVIGLATVETNSIVRELEIQTGIRIGEVQRERMTHRLAMEIVIGILEWNMSVIDPEIFDPWLVRARENVSKAIEESARIEDLPNDARR